MIIGVPPACRQTVLTDKKNKNKQMKQSFFILFFSFAFHLVHSQVGIGTKTPSSSTILDIYASNKGVLFPRVALQGKNDVTTITNGNQQGLLVYNTNTVADVTPGFYYWDNLEWQRFSTAIPSSTDYYQVVYYATNGQVQFNTPVAFSSTSKINVFRNGLRIGFNQIGATTIELEPEASCYLNDEIRIVQIN